ncbi:DNA-binding protein RFX2-like isoform X9 [Bolinopsis microptera]|uniref:DNA-binding protein RFX2-like isoform X9 n=1 Tax=Bolinopsis microptera TaxID=2820187 RepID=UPI00307A39A2
MATVVADNIAKALTAVATTSAKSGSTTTQPTNENSPRPVQQIHLQQISSSGGQNVRTSTTTSGTTRPHVAILRPIKGRNGQTLHIGKPSSGGTSRGFPIQLQQSGQTTYIQLDNATYRALTGKQTSTTEAAAPRPQTTSTVRPSNSAGSTSSGGQYVRLEYDVNTGHSTSPQYALDTPSDTPFHNTISHQNQYYDSYGNYYDRPHPGYHKLDFPDITSQRNSQAAIRAAPVTITWLMANYEVADGVSLPRCLMYSHYKQHCREHKLEPVNAASFGKIIRSIFINLKTRRLGTRGNSKYHYYGIRIKNDSILNSYGEEFSHPNRSKHISRISIQPNQPETVTCTENYENHIKFIGVPPKVFPKFQPLKIPEGVDLPEAISVEDVEHFSSSYLNHCVGIVYAVGLLNFPEVEGLWQSFWQGVGLTSQAYKNKLCKEYRKRDDTSGDEQDEIAVCDDKHVSKEVLHPMCEFVWVQEWVKVIDYSVYQMLIDIVMPDVLHPIPGSLTQMIRNFAKNMETVMLHALSGLPVKFLQAKCVAANAFAQTLRRYTSLNHLAQAARAVLQNSHQISQMLADLNRVDFTNVQEQASWVCGCSDAAVAELEKSFKGALEQQQGLEGWAAWLKNVVDQRLAPFTNKPEFPQHAKYFLLNWSFYCSMVIRDLTLRSAASFGSFHLIRLLYDEYMYYLVEQRVAKFRNTDPVVVMGECITLHQTMIKKCEEASKQVFSEHTQPMEPSSLSTPGNSSLYQGGDDGDEDDSFDSEDDDSHQLTSLDTGKTIPYLNKDSKTYSKTTRPGSHEHVQVKVEPRDHSNSAFNFDETEEEHTAKRPCVGNSMG